MMSREGGDDLKMLGIKNALGKIVLYKQEVEGRFFGFLGLQKLLNLI